MLSLVNLYSAYAWDLSPRPPLQRRGGDATSATKRHPSPVGEGPGVRARGVLRAKPRHPSPPRRLGSREPRRLAGPGVTLRVPKNVTPLPAAAGVKGTQPNSRAGGEGARRPTSQTPSPLSSAAAGVKRTQTISRAGGDATSAKKRHLSPVGEGPGGNRVRCLEGRPEGGCAARSDSEPRKGPTARR